MEGGVGGGGGGLTAVLRTEWSFISDLLDRLELDQS